MLQRLRRLSLVPVLACLAASAHAEAVLTITLKDALRRAREDPPAVLAAFALLQRVRAEEQYARGAYIPRLTVEAGSGVMYDNRATTPNKIDVPASVPPEQREAYRRAAQTPRYEATSLNNYGRVSLDYALLDRARRHTTDAASQRSGTQAAALAENRRSAQAAAAQLYIHSLAARELVADAHLTETRRREQHEAVKKLAKAGLRPSVDALRTEIEAVAARHAREAREVEEQAAAAALAVALGADPARPVHAMALDDASWPAPIEPVRAGAFAIEHRPEVRRVEAAVAASHADHRSALSARLPTLGVNGSGSVSHTGILNGTGIQGFSEVASGALYLRWAALDPEVWRRARVTQAALGEARRALEASLLAIRAEAVEAAYEVKRTRALLEQATQTMTAAQAARDSQNERYRGGFASLLELLDVEAVEQSARRQRIEAERDHRIARIRSLAVSGTLEELAR